MDSKDTYHNTSLGKWGLNWQNSVASLRWNHVYGHKLFGNAAITYNSYGMNMRAQANEEIHTEGQTSSYRYASDYRSAIRDEQEIWIYIPSARMRRLLKGWLANLQDSKH